MSEIRSLLLLLLLSCFSLLCDRKPNAMKQKNAFPPNFIHSLDSTHMMLTALYCLRYCSVLLGMVVTVTAATTIVMMIMMMTMILVVVVVVVVAVVVVVVCWLLNVPATC